MGGNTRYSKIVKPTKDSELAPWTWQFFVSEPRERKDRGNIFETIRFH